MFDIFQAVSSPVQRKELRVHQERAIEMLRQSMERGNRRVVIQGPTGFGKTLTAARIIEGALAKGNRVLVTAPAVSLIDQTVAAFEAEGIRDIGVIQADHPRTNPKAQVQVATVQSLARRTIPEVSMLIVDECHQRSAVIGRLMNNRPDLCCVGLSATPWTKGMGLQWQDLVIPITIGELIDMGFLSRFQVFAPDVPDLSGVRIAAGDFVERDVSAVMGGQALMASIVETWLEKGGNRPTLMFGASRSHAQQVAATFERAGVASGYVDAFSDTVERKLLEQRFRSGEIKVACSVRTLTTGIDWPVSCIIDAAPTRSQILHVQKIGRGLRVNPGSEDLLVLDHAGNSLRLGLVTDIRHAALDQGKGSRTRCHSRAEKLPKACTTCGALHSDPICPACGKERSLGPGIETLEGDLVEVSQVRGPKATRAEKQHWWGGLKSIQRMRNRTDGWAAHTYHEKFGIWPRGLSDTPTSATQEMFNFVKAKDIRFAKRNKANR